jgi:transcriptional regulator with XRE-family HTH domain
LRRSPSSIDRFVGSRVRLRRTALGVTQERLAQALGVTFQQVQKYEKGANRIGAGRLQEIARVLDAPPSFFYEGAPEIVSTGVREPAHTSATSVMLPAEGLQLIKAFMTIRDDRLRSSVLDLVRALARQSESSGSG